VRAGGHGVLIDDGGGGAWIGARALRAVLQLEDEAPGSGWATALGCRIGAEIGGASWDAARIFVYGGNRGSLGLLARSVAQAAAEGDSLACGIFTEAGDELGALAVTLRRRLGSLPVALIGRAAYLDPRVADNFARAVMPTVRLDAEPRDIAAVAAGLARQAAEQEGIA
jgi:N-acetylglucosamine kinase-like BadF-type ATPase